MLSSVSLLDAYIKNGAELSAKRSDAAETFMSNGLGGVKLIPRACVCAAFILSVVRAGAFILLEAVVAQTAHWSCASRGY